MREVELPFKRDAATQKMRMNRASLDILIEVLYKDCNSYSEVEFVTDNLISTIEIYSEGISENYEEEN